jgi:hypothetical protein
LIFETDGQFVRKYKPLAAESPGGPISWKWGISENGHTYLMVYDLFKETNSLIKIPGMVPAELDG